MSQEAEARIPAENRAIAGLRERLGRLEDAPTELKLYLVGAAFGSVGLALANASGVTGEAGRAVFVAGSVGLSLGLVKEAHDWLLPRLRSGAGKLLGALTLTMLGALVYDLAESATNIATGAPSGTFFNSTVVFAVLVSLQLLYVLIAILGFFVFLGVMSSSARWAVVDLWHTNILGRPSRMNVDREVMLWGVRLMAAFMLIMLAIAFGQRTERPLRDWSHSTIHAYVFHVAMDQNDPCAGSNERVARLSNDVILLARRDPTGYVFERRICGLLGGL